VSQTLNGAFFAIRIVSEAMLLEHFCELAAEFCIRVLTIFYTAEPKIIVRLKVCPCDLTFEDVYATGKDTDSRYPFFQLIFIIRYRSSFS